MKKLNEILSHLKNNPDFRRINTQKTIDKIIEILPPKMKKGVKFAYIRNQILFFVLTHPVYKMEFEYNKSLINDLLKKTNMTNINEIRFFVTNKIDKKEKNNNFQEDYKERSHGLFQNSIKDEKLHNKFEQIRQIIINS